MAHPPALPPSFFPDEADLGSLFSIELNERVYTLKAGNDVEAAKWVEVLNQLKVGFEGRTSGGRAGGEAESGDVRGGESRKMEGDGK